MLQKNSYSLNMNFDRRFYRNSDAARVFNQVKTRIKVKRASVKIKYHKYFSQGTSIRTSRGFRYILVVLLLLIGITLAIENENYINVSSPLNVSKTAAQEKVLTKPLYAFNLSNTTYNNLNFSTYFGGSKEDIGYQIVHDNTGNIYVCGMTGSTDFPTKNAYQPTNNGYDNAFIAKFNATGDLIFSTYFGGNNYDECYAITVDSNDNIYITGMTGSSNFPTKNAYNATYGGGNDAFIAKFNATGDLIFSTYFGGNSFDAGYGITVDSNENIFITGMTGSTNFPTKNAYQPTYGGINDAFITKLNSTGALVFSTYIGGSETDVGSGVAVDSNGNIYITGETASTNFPTKNAYQPTYGGGGYNAFIMKLNSTGTLTFSTYLGRGGGSSVVVDSYGNSYVTGSDGSGDVFITKFNTTGFPILNTYLGGNNSDGGIGITLDNSGNIYVTGVTASTNFPTKNAPQNTYGGSNDAFIAKFNVTGALLFSTYLGGSSGDIGYGIAVDNARNIYVIGDTSSSNFPTKNASQTINSGQDDAFITKFSPANTLVQINVTASNTSTITNSIISSSPVTTTTTSSNSTIIPPLINNLNLLIYPTIIIFFIIIGVIVYIANYKKRNYYVKNDANIGVIAISNPNTYTTNIDGVPSPKYTMNDPSIKYCLRCGNQVLAEDFFCSNCGVKQK